MHFALRAFHAENGPARQMVYQPDRIRAGLQSSSRNVSRAIDCKFTGGPPGIDCGGGANSEDEDCREKKFCHFVVPFLTNLR